MMHASSGILYNHESPRRGYEYVTRKITSHIAKIKLGLTDKLKLGNLDTKRDWGHAKEYVQAMWLMLQQDKPDDFVIATGKTHSIRDFLKLAFSHAGLDYKDYVEIDSQLVRPTDVNTLHGNPSKAREKLSWNSTITFEQLIIEMVNADIALLKKNLS